ncbi:LysR substrate-binding domain-containing protein [Sporomusa sp.]|uniref:LysR substrate-binding domain-containing protein n=1 Tax=Sporomusa sp. TaxID=2078658 RepID=UPI002CF0A8CC|nr:LysR substrate-binding domain-containing protein [Sporomusa sp.]HWR05284.1 LysR substrate-binding domain-containing protein [Sporomusa sp.]
MEIQLLREFTCLAEHLNFSTAAKQLFIAQPVLSRHIADLEYALGVQLFARNKQSVQLTPIGAVVLAETKAILTHYDEGIQKIRLAVAGFAGQLKIGFLGVPVKNFFPALISRFRSTYPNVDLQLNQLNLGALTNALKRGDIDICFTLSFDLAKMTGYCWKTLYSDSLAIVLRHDHPAASNHKINLSTLSQENFIILSPDESPGLHNQIIDLCAANGFSPNLVKLSAFPENALLMVESAIGAAILPRHIQVYASPELRFLDIEGGGTGFDVVVAWGEVHSNPAVPLFLQELEKLQLENRIC